MAGLGSARCLGVFLFQLLYEPSMRPRKVKIGESIRDIASEAASNGKAPAGTGA